jgi:hypothetical protein
MNEQTQDAFEERSRALFNDSVQDLDFATRSRLTRARHGALDAASASRARSWLFRSTVWKPAAGACAAVLLGAGLWLGTPLVHRGVADGTSNIEDLEIVASADEGSGDAMEMLQDDLEFYDFADKAANPEPAA